MDVRIPLVLNGLEATRWIRATWADVKVVALSIYVGKRYVAEMLKAGVHSYLLKERTPTSTSC